MDVGSTTGNTSNNNMANMLSSNPLGGLAASFASAQNGGNRQLVYHFYIGHIDSLRTSAICSRNQLGFRDG